MHLNSLRNLSFGIALTCLLSAGCTDHFLRKHTARTASTLTDIMFQQILDNMAMFCCEPDTLPHFAIIGDGSTQLADTGIVNPSLGWDARTLKAVGLGLNGQHQLVENWKLQPVMSAGRLKRMREAYRYVVCPRAYELVHLEGGAFMIADNECSPFLSEMIKMNLLPSPLKDLPMKNPCAVKIGPEGITFNHSEDAQAYLPKLQQALVCNFPTEWFCCGSRRDAPINCSRVGRYCRQRAWVEDCSIDELSRFTTTILALASQDPPPDSTVTFMRRIGAEDDVDAYQVTWTLPESKVDLAIPDELKACSSKPKEIVLGELKSHLDEIAKFAPESVNKWTIVDSPLTTSDLPGIKAQLKSQDRLPMNTREQSSAINKALRAVEQLESPRSDFISTPSPFDRSGNSPFSRGGGGVEFVPTVIP